MVTIDCFFRHLKEGRRGRIASNINRIISLRFSKHILDPLYGFYIIIKTLRAFSKITNLYQARAQSDVVPLSWLTQ